MPFFNGVVQRKHPTHLDLQLRRQEKESQKRDPLLGKKPLHVGIAKLHLQRQQLKAQRQPNNGPREVPAILIPTVGVIMIAARTGTGEVTHGLYILVRIVSTFCDYSDIFLTRVRK